MGKYFKIKSSIKLTHHDNTSHMRITSQYKVDLFQLKHSGDPVRLMELIRQEQAHKLGEKISELFPHTKNDEASFNGELPAASLNKEHEFNDRYDLSLHVLTEEEVSRRINELENEAEELFQELDDTEEGGKRLYAVCVIKELFRIINI